MRLAKIILTFCIPGAALSLQGCEGIFSGVYDEPQEKEATVAGQLYIDASSWNEWHYIDLKKVAAAVAADPDFNPSSEWRTFQIPVNEETMGNDNKTGIYTYWYDVFGEGIGNNEFRNYYPTEKQPEPDEWTFAVHRNNVRTNGCAVFQTDETDIDNISLTAPIKAAGFVSDEWNEQDVWVIQDKMLQGLIGNQGIMVNEVLSSWLRIEIPPVPPAFTLNSNVFVVRLPDNTYAALQLKNYQSQSGVKCCLTINYRYPL